MANETMEFDLLINGNPARNEIRSVQREVNNLGDSGREASKQFELSWVSAGAKVAAALYSVKKAFDFAKEIDTLNTRLEVATGSADNAKNKFAELDAMATKMGLSTQSLVEAYASFRVAADLAGSSSENTEKIFKAVTTASSAMKLSADDTRGVFLALTQMLSKGTVSAEELKQQFGERIPGALPLAAKAMGKTTTEFEKLLGTGQIIANDLLPKLADELENRFAAGALNASESIQASYNRLGNTFTNFKEIVLKALEGSGLITFFANAVTKIDEFIDRINRAITSIRDMSMIQRDAERLDIIKQIADKEEQIKNAYSFNKGRYEAELRSLKSKLNLIDQLNAKEKQSIEATKQAEKKTTPLKKEKTDPWIAKKVELEKMAVDETLNQYERQYRQLEIQRNADLAKFGNTAEKKALINEAYDNQMKAVQDKANKEMVEAHIKAMDEEFKASEENYQKQIETKQATADALKFIDDANIERIKNDMAELNIENPYDEKNIQNQKDAFKVREMAIGLLDNENAKTIALAQLEYEKNKAELDYKYMFENMDKTNYENQMKYLELIREKAIKSTSETATLFDGIESGLRTTMQGFFDFTSSNFLNMKKLAMDVLNQIYAQMVRQNIVNPMVSAIGTWARSANGNVFDSSGIKRYAQGGVINSPTQFRFAGGAGIMGEKGSEAIMPLKRMQNGNLGVESAIPTMKVEIKNESGSKMEVTSSTVSQDTEGMVLGIVINAVNTNKMGTRDMIRGLR